MRRGMRAALAGAACLGAAACPPHADVTPPIHVSPGAAAIWGKVMAAPSVPEPAPKPSRAHPMGDGEQLGGPNAIGRPGDWILENDEVVFVIDRIGSSAGFAESGGNIVDAADARTRKDELGQMFTYFGKFPRQGVYQAVNGGAASDGSAFVEAKGRELYEPSVMVTTRYTLQPTDRALLLETTLENTGPGPVTLPALGDAIQWGGAEKMAPEKPIGFKGPSSGPYVAGVGRLASYAVTSTDGHIDGTSGGSWTDTSVRKDVTLAPRQKAAYARILLVGERPDSSSLVAELMKAAAQPVGIVDIELESIGEGAALPIPADAQVAVRDPRDAQGADLLTIHASGDPPRLHAELPPGRWALAYTRGGGRAGTSPVAIEVAPKTARRARLAVTSAAAAHVACISADGSGMPCKVTFERTDGAPPPDFGPAHAAGPARNQVTTADGVTDVDLAPGAYRVTASRGPEYALAQSSLNLAPGEHGTLSLSPKRVLDTTGYLGCDFHQHTMLGADAPVSTRDRVIANAAEGVEVAVATEHNVVADMEPIVKAWHLEHELVSVPGDELTTDASRHAWGHANAWPMAFDSGEPRGGAPAVRDLSPRELIDQLRHGQPADFVFQINHPRSGANGYFDLLGFNQETGAGTNADYDPRFDALEVWNGRNVEARAKVLLDFFALLRTSHPVTATADTDTHGIVGQEAGYPRTYVRVADDDHLEGWNAARTQDVVHGVKGLRDVVLTNGPMLRVTANGAPIGGRARGRLVRIKVHVESAPWVVVDHVDLLRASLTGGAGGVGVPITETPLASGAIGADTSFLLALAADDAFVIVASGKKPMTPVLGAAPPSGPDAAARDADAAATMPWAMTGAIWVDADGDGKALGR